jgi:hypothetical protein
VDVFRRAHRHWCGAQQAVDHRRHERLHPGTYSGAPDGDLPPLGTISWISDYDGADALDWMITISASVPAAEMRPPMTVVLCNSTFQVEPGA